MDSDLRIFCGYADLFDFLLHQVTSKIKKGQGLRHQYVYFSLEKKESWLISRWDMEPSGDRYGVLLSLWLTSFLGFLYLLFLVGDLMLSSWSSKSSFSSVFSSELCIWFPQSSFLYLSPYWVALLKRSTSSWNLRVWLGCHRVSFCRYRTCFGCWLSVDQNRD